MLYLSMLYDLYNLNQYRLFTYILFLLFFVKTMDHLMCVQNSTQIVMYN
jgi:hypothetical protein